MRLFTRFFSVRYRFFTTATCFISSQDRTIFRTILTRDIYSPSLILTPSTYSIEHIIPQSLFPADHRRNDAHDIMNLWTTHRSTNSRRSNHPYYLLCNGTSILPPQTRKTRKKTHFLLHPSFCELGLIVRSILYMISTYPYLQTYHPLSRIIVMEHQETTDIFLYLHDLHKEYAITDYERLKYNHPLLKKKILTQSIHGLLS